MMSRFRSLLTLIAGLILALSSAKAVTVFSTTGTPTSCGSTGGNSFAAGAGAPQAYKMFRDKQNECVKVVLKPNGQPSQRTAA